MNSDHQCWFPRKMRLDDQWIRVLCDHCSGPMAVTADAHSRPSELGSLRLQSVPQSTLAPLFLPGSAHQRAMRPGTGQVAVMHYIAKPELLNVLPAVVTTLIAQGLGNR